MTRAWLLSLLLAASVASAREKVRPKSNVSPVRQGQSQPTPPPEPAVDPDDTADKTDNEADPGDMNPPDKADPNAAAAKDSDDDDDAPPSRPGVSASGKTKKSKAEEDQDAAVGLAFLCCCFLVFAGIVALIVWLVRRKPGTPPPAAYRPGQTGGSAGPFHLSVAAIALDARTRGVIDSRFNALGGAGNAGAPPTKGAISRALAQALLEQKDNWRWFGYGEKPLMYAFGEADISFRAATDDFRARANTAASGPEGELVVYTLVVCANRLLKGVTRLDSIVEAQEVFLERSRVQDHEVFGGDVISSPLSGGMSEAELTQRYPEMNRLVSAVG
jgi:hypothetical protein